MIGNSAIRGALAVLLCAALAPPAASAADDPDSTGGAVAPAPAGAPGASGDPSITLGLRAAPIVGVPVGVAGQAPAAAGGAALVEQLSPTGEWLPAATAPVDPSGSFSTSWIPPAPGPAILRVAASAPGARASRASPPQSFLVLARARVTWYGPGFMGKRTACGPRLRQRTLGVAHRRLPCGTKVALAYGSRSIVVPVIDRGPFANGAEYDLTRATAKRLGVRGTTRIGALPLPPAT